MTTCPDYDALERLASRPQGEWEEPLRDHLLRCEACRGRLHDVRENLAVAGALRGAAGLPAEPAVATPARVGGFTIVRELDRGGMGVVYLAEQARPRRRVALKLIRPGAATAEMLRRLDFEANVLAQLQHPGIAQVFEAGVTEVVYPGGVGDRQPYFAMEYVEGRRLDEFVREGGLSDRERLELLASIADTLHYAHLKGVVHRDLKPGNILVAESGTPKILDFGVARLVGSGIETGGMETRPGRLLGTLPFMSPEQVAGDPGAIDPRSDVYSLGVTAFVLLSGRLPYPMESSSLLEAARVIRDDPPLRLSAVAPRFRGDVDVIVAKALEKERERRYQSASELAADLRRFLRGEPIAARLPSTAYQVRKLVARHRVPAALAGAFLLLLAVFGVTMALLFGRARSAERAAGRAREDASREAATATQVSRFMEDLFLEADPYVGEGGDVRLVDVLDRGARRAAKSLEGEPEVRARLLRAIANAHAGLGAFERAGPLLEEALRTRRSAGGEEGRGVAQLLNDQAELAFAMGDLPRQERLLDDVLSRRGASLAADDPEVARALFARGRNLFDRGEVEAAAALLEETLAIRRAHFGDEDARTAEAIHQLGRIREHTGDSERAEALYREALAIRRRTLGEESPWLAQSLNDLAVQLERKSQYEEAADLFREALELQRVRLGEDHPDLAVPYSNLAGVLVKSGDLRAAEPLYRRALDIQRRFLPDDHPLLAWRLHNLAVVLGRTERAKEAEPLLRQALAIRERSLPPGDWQTAETRGVLGETLGLLGRYAEGAPMLLESWRRLEAARGAQDRLTLRARERIARLYEAWGERPPPAFRATAP